MIFRSILTKLLFLLFFCFLSISLSLNNTQAAAGGPRTIYINYSTGNDATGDGSSETPYKTFHQGYTMANSNDILDLTGTFTWSNSDETGDNNDGYTINKNLTILGHGPDQTILQSATTYGGKDRRIFYIAPSTVLSISSTTIRYGYTAGSGTTYAGGGCIYADTDSSLTINASEINNCYSDYSSGGGVLSLGNATISDSAIHDNITNSNTATVYGAGIYFNANGYNLTLTNSSIYLNTMTQNASGTRYGGGLYIGAGTVTTTNCTFFGNGSWVDFGGGIYMANSASAILYLKNTILSGNTSGGSTQDNIYKNSSAIINNNGYNIIGNSTNYTANTGDWTDAGSGTATDGIYGLYGSSATGTPGLDSSAGVNLSLYGTKSYALLTGSIGINNGNNVSNNGTSIPSTDQRGASRNGTTDIGAYEYGGTFNGVTHTFSYTAGANGSITGSSTQVVTHGTSGTAVVATPNSGYAFSSWSDGLSTASRTDTNASSSISVTANFITAYTLNYSAGTHGSLTGSSTQVIGSGGNSSAITAVADANYHFVNWSDNSTSNPRTDTNVVANLSVTANFAINTYTVTYSAGANGSITGSSTQVVNYASSTLAVTATANTNYHFTNWNDASTANPRTDTNITSDQSFSANFAINNYTFSYTAGANGSLTGSTTQVVNYGGNGSAITATPSTGYRFVNWSDNSTANPRTDSNATSTISVTANFSLIDAPIISGVSSTPASSSATIIWTTDIIASSKIVYGPTNSYGTSTSETDTSPRVTSHNLTLSSLNNCTTYHYRTISSNINTTYATSSDYYFTTTGCIGSSSITDSYDAIASTTATSSISLLTSGLGLTLNIPPDYASSSADFQIKKLVKSTVLGVIGRPSGYVEVGEKVYNLSAITNSSQSISTFSKNLSVVISYEDNDLSGVFESTLKIFRWDGSSWNMLSDCVINGTLNTVTCNTPGFSTFGLFGRTVENSITASSAFGGTRPPISYPIIRINPFVSGNTIKMNVSNAGYMAVAPNPYFNATSWEKYQNDYQLMANSSPTLYIKFRSSDGGESSVCTVQKPMPATEKPKTTDSPKKSTVPCPSASIKITNLDLFEKLKGKIVLRVEDLGQAYYIHYKNPVAYCLGRPADAFKVMREQGVGISNKGLKEIPYEMVNSSGQDTDQDGVSDAFEDAIGTNKKKIDSDDDGKEDQYELINYLNPNGSGYLSFYEKIAKKNVGRIFLQTQNNGEAWYVNPGNVKRYFLGRPIDAFTITKNLGVGISNKNFDELIKTELTVTKK